MSRGATYRIFILILLSCFSLATRAQQSDSLQYSGGEDTVQVSPGTLLPGRDSMLGRLDTYAQGLRDRYQKSPLFINILYVVILYSIITLITLLVIILIHRRRLERIDRKRESLKEEYQQLLMNYLFNEEERDREVAMLRKVARSAFDRQVLIDQMIDLSVNLKGDIKDAIRELYLLLSLEQDSLEKARSRKWHLNVKGFRELAFMNIRDANDKIIESLNSGNEILRMEAQIAMVRLSDDNPYEFLNLLEKPLALWEQVTLHEMLIQHNLKVPAFRQWFTSENESIVMYALEMVSWFKQKGVANEIIGLLSHESERIRNTAIKVCGELGLKTSLPSLKKIYWQESYRNKLDILRTFASVPDAKHLDFLKSVLDAEEDVQLQILATRAMENTDEPGISLLIKLMKSKSEYKNYQIIIRHVLDGRIY